MNLEADALEQLGYQAENGPWRNFYLTGAQELRKGVAELPTPNTASPDTVRAMSLDIVFDYLGVRLDSQKAADAKMKLNFDVGGDDDGKISVQFANGTAFVRRSECVPNLAGSSPMLATHSCTSRAYCRVVRPPLSPRPAKRNWPSLRPVKRRYSSMACQV